jgi:hypothetical protein
MPGSWPLHDFPVLTDADWVAPPSAATRRYNCIAWSVGRSDRKWWPDRWGVGQWFPNVPRIETVAGFLLGYTSVGYAIAADGTLEAGIEKLALYAKMGPAGDLIPTHAAYQLDNGRWTSKLGDFEDIEHFQTGTLDGPQYGSVILYLQRIRQPRPPPPKN